MYIYPDNLKSKATLWLWALRDLAIIGIGSLISVFALSQLGFFVPIVLTAAYAFLSNTNRCFTQTIYGMEIQMNMQKKHSYLCTSR